MTIRRNRKPDRYTNIDNELLERGDITWRSKGLLCYLLSRPDNWNANVEHLAKFTDSSCKPAKRDAVREMLAELEGLGYITRTPARDDAGKLCGMEYIVHDSPQTDLPATDLPATDLPGPVNPILINTDRAIKTEIEKPAPAKAGAKCTFAEFTRMCEEASEQRVSGDDEAFKDLRAAGIPDAFIELHTAWFLRWAEQLDASGKPRKYAGVKGWRQAFRNSVRGNWSKLWYLDNKSGQWCLTQAGIMAQAAKNRRE